MKLARAVGCMMELLLDVGKKRVSRNEQMVADAGWERVPHVSYPLVLCTAGPVAWAVAYLVLVVLRNKAGRALRVLGQIVSSMMSGSTKGPVLHC